MNGVHDMGGMHGLGPIAPEADEPVFHARWEARVLALTLAAGAWGRWNIDAARHARESTPGAEYLRMSYYEIWFAGLVSRGEIASGRPAAGATKSMPPLTAEKVAGTLARGGPATRGGTRAPQFAQGDRVRTRNINPTGHTRLPRYARNHVGAVTRVHGCHVFPDANAHGLGEQPQPLYQVRFEARELWGEKDARGKNAVHIDLWEDYLEPA